MSRDSGLRPSVHSTQDFWHANAPLSFLLRARTLISPRHLGLSRFADGMFARIPESPSRNVTKKTQGLTMTDDRTVRYFSRLASRRGRIAGSNCKWKWVFALRGSGNGPDSQMRDIEAISDRRVVDVRESLVVIGDISEISEAATSGCSIRHESSVFIQESTNTASSWRIDIDYTFRNVTGEQISVLRPPTASFGSSRLSRLTLHQICRSPSQESLPLTIAIPTPNHQNRTRTTNPVQH
jgi:hypothetical protein